MDGILGTVSILLLFDYTYFGQRLVAPVTSIFNICLSEGVLPTLLKTQEQKVPLPVEQPPDSVENDIRPISLPPILANVFV